MRAIRFNSILKSISNSMFLLSGLIVVSSGCTFSSGASSASSSDSVPISRVNLNGESNSSADRIAPQATAISTTVPVAPKIVSTHFATRLGSCDSDSISQVYIVDTTRVKGKALTDPCDSGDALSTISEIEDAAEDPCQGEVLHDAIVNTPYCIQEQKAANVDSSGGQTCIAVGQGFGSTVGTTSNIQNFPSLNVYFNMPYQIPTPYGVAGALSQNYAGFSSLHTPLAVCTAISE